MPKSRWTLPRLECLEDRAVPAIISLTYDAPGSLCIKGQADDLDVNFTADNQVQIIADSTNLGTFPATSLAVRVRQLIATQQTLDVNLAGFTMTGNLTIQGLASSEILTIDGGNGLVGGRVSITETANLPASPNAIQDLTIGGSLTIARGAATSTALHQIFNLANVLVGGSITFTGGNGPDTLALNTVTVGTNVAVTSGLGFNNFSFSADSVIGTSFTYSGGDGDDNLTNLDGVIGSTAYISLGNGVNTLIFTGEVGTDMTISGGSGTDLLLNFSGTVGRNLTVNLGNATTNPGASNTFDFSGAVFGSRFSYVGGLGLDDLDLNGTLANVYVDIRLGGSVDDLAMTAAVGRLRYLFVDFGAGNDLFTHAALNYPFYIINLP